MWYILIEAVGRYHMNYKSSKTLVLLVTYHGLWGQLQSSNRRPQLINARRNRRVDSISRHGLYFNLDLFLLRIVVCKILKQKNVFQ